MTTLATAMGAHPLTMLGLGGIGDLVLTCTGDLSRNRTVGLRIGRGEKLEAITHSMGGSHAEGVLTARSAYQLARSMGLDCATIEGIYRVLYGGGLRWEGGLLACGPSQFGREERLRPRLGPPQPRASPVAHPAPAPRRAPPPPRCSAAPPEGADPMETVKENMSRELKHEVPESLQQKIPRAGSVRGHGGGAAAAAPAGHAPAADAARPS